MRIKSVWFVILGIISIIISIIFNNYSSNSLEKLNSTMSAFNKNNAEDEKVFLYLKKPFINSNGYYIDYIDDTYYILKSNIDLNEHDFDGKYIRVIGNAKTISNSEKEMFLKTYNDQFNYSESSKISEEEFYEYFGNSYIEVSDVVNDIDVGKLSADFSRLFLEIGIIFFVIVMLNLVVYIKKQIY